LSQLLALPGAEGREDLVLDGTLRRCRGFELLHAARREVDGVVQPHPTFPMIEPADLTPEAVLGAVAAVNAAGRAPG